jgi:exosortase/archaeosortase family protein
VQMGTTFEVSGHQFFVQDACSGIHSLLALLCVSALWSVYEQRSLPAALCSLACAAWAAVWLNVLRVFGVILVYTHWGVDLSTGWRHELWGLVLFGVSLGFLWSAHQLWLFWCSGLPAEFSDSDSSVRPADEYPTVDIRELATPRVRFRWTTVMAGCVLLLWFPQLAHVARALSADRLVESSLSVAPPALAVTEQDLPQQLQGWPRLGFNAVERDRHSLEGEFSRQWTYQAPFGTVHVVFDFPFEGAHPLLRCYKATGWDSTVLQTVAVAATRETNIGGFQEVSLERREFEEGFLLFSLWDSNGELISLRPAEGAVAPQPLLTRLWNRVLPTVEAGTSIAPTTYQLQVLIVSEFSLSEPDRTAARQLFLETRDRFRDRFRPRSGMAGTNPASSSNDN